MAKSAISLSCLLQDYPDVCNGPVILIITVIRLLRDPLPPLSAIVNFFVDFTENEKYYFTGTGKPKSVYIVLIPS